MESTFRNNCNKGIGKCKRQTVAAVSWRKKNIFFFFLVAHKQNTGERKKRRNGAFESAFNFNSCTFSPGMSLSENSWNYLNVHGASFRMQHRNEQCCYSNKNNLNIMLWIVPKNNDHRCSRSSFLEWTGLWKSKKYLKIVTITCPYSHHSIGGYLLPI